MQRSQSRSSLSASFEALAVYFPCMNSLEEEEGGEEVKKARGGKQSTLAGKRDAQKRQEGDEEAVLAADGGREGRRQELGVSFNGGRGVCDYCRGQGLPGPTVTCTPQDRSLSGRAPFLCGDYCRDPGLP